MYCTVDSKSDSPSRSCSVVEFPVSTYSDVLVLITSVCPSNVIYIPVV